MTNKNSWNEEKCDTVTTKYSAVANIHSNLFSIPMNDIDAYRSYKKRLSERGIQASKRNRKR